MSREAPRPYVWLQEFLDDPDIMKPPTSVAPRLVWSKRVTLLAAREKCGKSTLAGAAAAAVSTGAAFLGERCIPGNVLIVSLEEHPQEFVQRLMKFGADPARIAIVQGGGADLVEDIREAADAVEPSLIIWDTLGAFANHISPKSLEPNDSQGWTQVMMVILDISREYGASLLLHHSSKSTGKYRDSTAIGANVDAIIEMYGEDDEPRTLKTKARFPTSEFRVTLDDAEGFRVLESREDVDKRLLAFVAANPRCTLRELREGVPGRSTDISASRDRLLKDGRLLNVGSPASHAYMAKKG